MVFGGNGRKEVASDEERRRRRLCHVGHVLVTLHFPTLPGSGNHSFMVARRPGSDDMMSYLCQFIIPVLV